VLTSFEESANESIGRENQIRSRVNMKTLTKLTVAAALAAFLGTTAAFADDPQLQNRLTIYHAQAARNQQPTTTVAVYGTAGVGHRGEHIRHAGKRMERHDTGRGTHYLYRVDR
jgi:D-arabinose 1-dehydrogenase-like Zn-dependent alcohol dehydrogenase